MKKLFILLFFSSMLCTLRAQSWYGPDTSFWLGFIPHEYISQNDHIVFSVTSCSSGVVTISNPNSSWSDTIIVSAGVTRNKEYNSSVSGLNPYGGVTSDAEFLSITGIPINSGLHVSSTTPITLSVCTRYKDPGLIDACQIIPTAQLGSEYVIQSHEINTSLHGSYSSNICIVAADPKGKAVVDVYLTSNTSNGWAAGSHQVIALNSGQCVNIQSSTAVGLQDLSGTIIRARDYSKIAVFEGNRFVKVPIEKYSSDMLFNQSLPTHSWGTEYVAVPVIGHENAYVRVTAGADTCQVFFDGILKTTLSSYENYMEEITHATYITTSKPSSVAYYVDSRHTSGGVEYGDCALTTLLPLSHHDEKGAYFSTFQMDSRGYPSHYYLNIVTPTNQTSQMRLDDHNISNFIPVGTSGYSYSRVTLDAGNHVVYTDPSSWFIAQVIGLDENWEGYIHNIGGEGVCDSTASIKEETVVAPTITPNPSHDKVYVRCPVEIQSYELFSISGIKMLEHSVGELDVSINVENLSKGVYILYLHTSKGLIIEKIVVE